MRHIVMQLERGIMQTARWGVFDAESRMIRAEVIGVENAELIARLLDDSEVFKRAAQGQWLRDCLCDIARNLRHRAQEVRALGDAGEHIARALDELADGLRRQTEGRD